MRKKTGTNIVRRNRPGWKPEKGQRVGYGRISIPERAGFTIVLAVVVAIVIWLQVRYGILG